MRYAVGDTVTFVWSASQGVDSSTVVDLRLDRNNGQSGYTELLAENVPYKTQSALNWVVTGPECDSCILKVEAEDMVENTAVGYTQLMETFSICGWKVGDADGNGLWTIGDAVYIINYIFAGGPAPTPSMPGSGDADANTLVTITDAVEIINYVFEGGRIPGHGLTCADY